MIQKMLFKGSTVDRLTSTDIGLLCKISIALGALSDLEFGKLGFESRFMTKDSLLDRAIACLDAPCQQQVVDENKSEVQRFNLPFLFQ